MGQLSKVYACEIWHVLLLIEEVITIPIFRTSPSLEPHEEYQYHTNIRHNNKQQRRRTSYAKCCKLEVLVVRVLNTGTENTTGNTTGNTDATVDDWSLSCVFVCLFVCEGGPYLHWA